MAHLTKIENYKAFIFKFKEGEINFLMSILQNPIGCTPEEEDEETKEYRKQLWETFHEATLLSKDI